jgi:lipopolysaccharide export system protein LptA
VMAQTATGTVRSNAMDIYFTSGTPKAAPGRSSAPADVSGSQVSKIVARGDVRLEQPGRKGTGEELTYTAADAKFVLTGTSATPPRLSDQVRGTVTGTALIFNDRDDSVVVSGGASKAVTQTHVAK